MSHDIRSPAAGVDRSGVRSASNPLASRRPRTEEELLTVSGIGPTIVSKYGKEILEILGGG